MQEAEQSRKIKVKKRGNALGFWFFKVFLIFFGLQGAYRLLYLVCFHYALFDWPAISAAMAYVSRRFESCSYIQCRIHIYKLFISQGKQLIDRYALISKRVHFDITLKGYEQLVSLARDTEHGFILLMTHVGNWQIAMTTLKELKKTVYLLMRPEDNQALQKELGISSEYSYVKIISPEQYLGGVVEIMNALKDGHVVAMMGDREYGFNGVDINFFGEKARFPQSAFSIAAAAKCPAVVLMSTKIAARKYCVEVAKVINPRYERGIKKQDLLRNTVQEFASILEAYLVKYPYQCFLFHNVWKKSQGDQREYVKNGRGSNG